MIFVTFVTDILPAFLYSFSQTRKKGGFKLDKMTQFFEHEEKEVLQEAEKFHKILTDLRYEGKVARGRNVKAAKRVVRDLNKLMKHHQDFQEKIIFPFLVIHIPKHEAVIHFLRTDHQDIQKNRRKLEASLRRLSRKICERVEDANIQETGIYLIGLLRHHFELESKSIHKAIRKELREDERLEVERKVNQWLTHHHKMRHFF